MLEDCFVEYSREERLEGENRYDCTSCAATVNGTRQLLLGMRSADGPPAASTATPVTAAGQDDVREAAVVAPSPPTESWPNVLVVHLVRHRFNKLAGTTAKVDHSVDMPVTLEFSGTTQLSVCCVPDTEAVTYDLIAVVVRNSLRAVQCVTVAKAVALIFFAEPFWVIIALRPLRGRCAWG